MHNKTMIRFGFCLSLSVRVISFGVRYKPLRRTLIILDITSATPLETQSVTPGLSDTASRRGCRERDQGREGKDYLLEQLLDSAKELRTFATVSVRPKILQLDL